MRPWDSLSEDEKRLFRRMAEVYAGFLAHADDQIGRLLDYLEESGQRENTIVVVVSDNGASGEGGPNGSVNENRLFNGMPDDLDSALAMLDELGGPKTYNHYANGWAMAFNTPFKMWKRYEYNGGTSDACIISWPTGTKAKGEMRTQYHHAIDLVPTILDVSGCRGTVAHQGARAEPLRRGEHALQLRRRRAPTSRATQFYSMLGSRGIWHDGWKAVTTHPTIAGWSNFNDDVWELYHTDVDRSELHNLADEEPEKLRELINLWFAEAGAQRRVPTGRSLAARDHPDPAPAPVPAPGPLRLLPRRRGRTRVAGGERPQPLVRHRRTRGHPRAGAEGVLFAQGARFGGHALYMKDNRLHYVYNFVGMMEQKIDGTEDVPDRRESDPCRPRSTRTARTRRGVATGILSLYHGDNKVGEGRIKTQPGFFAIAGEGLCVGRDSGEAVTDDYPGAAPYRFTGGPSSGLRST